MSINNKNHVINKLVALKEEDYSKVEVGVYLVNRDSQKDDLYFSKLVEVEEPIQDFLRNHIIKEVKDHKKHDENFPIQDYNHEFKLNDYIGQFNLKKQGDKNKVTKNLGKLNKAMASDDLEKIKHAKFQIVTLKYQNEMVRFCFYKGTKKTAKNNKLAIFSSEELKIVNSELVEFGGRIAFFADKTDIYVIDPKNFEYAFEYTDHISEVSSKNIETITTMKFFTDKKVVNEFKVASGHHLFARGSANIKPETLKDLEVHFDARVTELKKIKASRDKIKDTVKRKEFEQNLGELNVLIGFIDFSNNSIKFAEKDDPKPLLHFFQDKIVTSFLTKKIRVMMGI